MAAFLYLMVDFFMRQHVIEFWSELKINTGWLHIHRKDLDWFPLLLPESSIRLELRLPMV
jgi:hypothetical protein